MSDLHPFSKFIRVLGRGKKGSRALSRQEAYEAMGMILDGHVEREQLGAFLMLVRVKEETPDEVAGFVQAVRDRLQLPGNLPVVDLDWSSYAGKRRQLPWFILSVLVLVENGVRVFMHGIEGRKDDRVYTPQVLDTLGLPVSSTLSEAAHQLQQGGFAYLNLNAMFPSLQRLIDLRDLLGLRSPVHTVSRMVNPFQAPFQMQGIFHPGYLEIHQGAATLLEQPHMAVIKGDGGEIEINPDGETRVLSVHDGVETEERWPSLFERRHVKPDHLDPTLLRAVWRGESEDEYGIGAVTETLAVTLKMLGRASTVDEARALADRLWQARNLDTLA